MNRLNFVKNFKAYTLRMKDRRQQNMAMLRSYLKKQRSIIIQNTRRRMLKGVMWIGLLSVSYYFAHKIYSQKLEVKQMEKKLLRLYPSIATKIQTEGNNEVYYVVPQYDDQLANIIEMCWKYHFKVIVNTELIDPQMKNQKINQFLTGIPQPVKDKCLIINLQKLKNIEFDEINGLVKVQSGISCKELNQTLSKRGYSPIFPEQIAQNLNQTVYNAVVNNYPTLNGPISCNIANLDLISPQGQYFRSSNENNQYGATPNLNTIFVGTGGIFGLPIKTKFKIQSKSKSQPNLKTFKIDSDDLNQKLLATRKLKSLLRSTNENLSVQIFNAGQNAIDINLKAKQGSNSVLQNIVSNFKTQLPDLKQMLPSQAGSQRDFNIFFNVNQTGFQKFLIFKQNSSKQQLPFNYSENLLKIKCTNQSVLIQIISEICSQNGVVVWCKDHKFMKQIKKVTDQSQVGSQLMKILVQIRQGIDHKKIYYTHNRYQEYFAKGTFRKLTQVFW